MPRLAHIAMVGTPLVGHALPSLAIIRELVARGHRVTYATAAPVAELIAPTGAELVGVTSTLPVAARDWPQDPIASASLFLGEAMAVLPQLHAAYDDDPADVYLYDAGAYAGRALAEAQGRRFVQLSAAHVAWEGAHEEIGAALARLPGGLAHRARFAAWLDRCGAVTTDVVEFTGHPRRVLAMVPRAMQPHAERVDTEAVTFVGPCHGVGQEQDGWMRPAGAKKVLLVSLTGSAYQGAQEIYHQCVAAFADLPGWHVVLQTSSGGAPGERVPRNFEVRPWGAPLPILEHADVWVTHTGVGSSGEGLYAGVPMIAVPNGPDQSLHADRLVELGVARRIDGAHVTAATLRCALMELIGDPRVAARSAWLWSEVRAEGGTRRAADLIEDQLVGDRVG
ncbi:macrolide-inactivating glycosyltransferase [Streptomyces filipinensis]|uniref:Macrolide-inactivating glycosyltransferase n=1 Tax=Streptomyces filipinensis TaxID=66887 RepID=A0A918I9S3_9ACTN|nr:macrolide family glycosyltransferase [Streptomyces filipinensis]GGU92241.1 macrolide-inactivating glycosyltransferase [Streptomyces filipinensis]